VYEVGEVSPVRKMLTIDVDDAYDWLDAHVGDDRYGDIQVYDVSWVGQRDPIPVRTLPSTRRRL
jgi:hypothetical protein